MVSCCLACYFQHDAHLANPPSLYFFCSSVGAKTLQQCKAYIDQGAALDVGVFIAWFEPRAAGAWLQTEKDADENTLLLAVLEKSDAPEAVALAVLSACPGAARVKNQRDLLPLHLALKNKRTEAVTLAVLSAYPDGAKEKNKRGKLPLQVALKNKATPEAVLIALIAACPDAVSEREKDGTGSPEKKKINPPTPQVCVILPPLSKSRPMLSDRTLLQLFFFFFRRLDTAAQRAEDQGV